MDEVEEENKVIYECPGCGIEVYVYHEGEHFLDTAPGIYCNECDEFMG